VEEFRTSILIAQQGRPMMEYGKLLAGRRRRGLRSPYPSAPPSAPWLRDTSAPWLRRAEQLAALDARLPQFLAREAKPVDAAECAQVGWLCQQPYKQLNAASARFYADAFAAEPKLENDLGSSYRYKAACAAAMAGCGQGKDAGDLDDTEGARLRRRALDWLRADLAAWRKQLGEKEVQLRPVVQQTLQTWLAETDFTRVRDSVALAKLPEAERQDWQKLWAEVQELFAKVGGEGSRTKK
jgi:hypothetical protein